MTDFNRVPQELKDKEQWVLWKYVLRKETNQKSKVPFSTNGQYADVSKPTTWKSQALCSAMFSCGGYEGCGYMFKKEDGIVGIDLDHCYRPDGSLEDWATEILNMFPDTYVEKSPSGDGLHIFCRGKMKKVGAKKWIGARGIEQGIEVYDNHRYFTVTGDTLSACNVISECQTGLDWLFQKYFPENSSATKSDTRSHDLAAVESALSAIGADDYDTWIKVGMALKSGGFDVALWDNWSRKSKKHAAGQCEEKWKSFEDGAIEIGTLFYLARGSQSRHSSKIETISALDLAHLDIPEQKWIVDEVLPVGLTVLAGPPKIGKSWLAFSIGLSISSGHKALASFETQQGRVLYLALEDNKERLKTRLLKLTEGDSSLISANLEMSNSISRQDEGGLEGLESWLEDHPNCKLVIIDTLARFSANPSGKRNAYDNDYRALAPLQALAMKRGISILLITHLRKQAGGDPLTQVMGSTGVTGVADAIWLMKRSNSADSSVLSISGRDAEEKELALKLDPQTCQWQNLGDADFVQMSAERKAILSLLESESNPIGPKEIAERLEMKEANVKQLLRKMFDAQAVNRENGKYFLDKDQSPRSLFKKMTDKPNIDETLEGDRV